MHIKKLFSLLLACFFIILSTSFCTIAGSSPTIETTLTDSVQKGSKKTFDVTAKNSSGKKIASTVTLNGKNVASVWNDSDKTSYILTFTHEGKNYVVISASSSGKTAKKSYVITYQKAKKGEIIGQATFSVELFTIGNGYLVEPVKVNIIEGESASQTMLKLLKAKGYAAYYGGNSNASFYLAYIADGNKTAAKYNGYSNSASVYGSPKNPKKLNIKTNIPKVMYLHLQKTMDFFDDNDYEASWKGYIGEFVYTNGSGWMFSINNKFPNVSFSDYYLSDGDVARVEFTLAYGADIGGTSTLGKENGMPDTEFFAVADKDRLTSLLSDINSGGNKLNSSIKSEYSAALSAIKSVNASQSKINKAYSALYNKYKKIGYISSSSNSAAKSSTASTAAKINGSETTTLKSTAVNSSVTSVSGNEKKSDATGNNSVKVNSGSTEKSSSPKNKIIANVKKHKTYILVIIASISAAAALTAFIIIYKKRHSEKIKAAPHK